MTNIQNEVVQNDFFQTAFAGNLYNQIFIEKINDLEQRLSIMQNQVDKNEQDISSFCTTEIGKILFFDNERRKIKKEKTSEIEDRWQGSGKIVERALEILTEWEDVQDIKFQIQYAAIIVCKIDNIKKKNVIHADDIRNKICTLLRNVIRLNTTEGILSKEQISVLKEGFSLITAEEIQKEHLLQLNRKLRKKGLSTMPAWE